MAGGGGESNTGFHQLSNSGGSSSSSGGGYMGNYYSNPPGVITDGIPIYASSSSGGVVPDSVPGLKHDTGLAVEWSVEEQYKLEQGLAKYVNEPNIMRYIKIAASLQDKTVRDVALRCRWLTRKRRKQDNQNLGKKVKDKKDIFESYLKNNISSALSMNVPAYSLTNHQEQSGCMLSGALSCRHLLEENSQAFGEISANLSTLKLLRMVSMANQLAQLYTCSEFPNLLFGQLQENVDLFYRTKNNIATILNDMSNMPGIISRMPPLPVFLNEELASSIFPRPSQPIMFGKSNVVALKQEPRC